MRELASSDEPSRLGCVLALCLALLPGIAGAIIRPSPAEEWPFDLFWGVIFALPFGYLALATRRWVPWVFTAILTVCIWGALIIVTVRGEPGVNFGIALLMLAAPIVITAAAATAVYVTSKRS